MRSRQTELPHLSGIGADPLGTQPSLRDISLLFLKLGTIGFGGPAAHIALMEAEVVRRRRWLSHEDFLDLLGATNLIPGPNSTEMAIHVGYRKARSEETRLNSSHSQISYAVFCLKKKK